MHLWGRGVLEEACLEMRNVRGWGFVGGCERGWGGGVLREVGSGCRWGGRERYGWGMNGVGGRTWFD